MRAKIYGVQAVDFVSPEGTPIVGKNIYVGFENRYVDGLKTNKYFVNKNCDGYSDLQPDLDITIDFNEKGKVESIEII